MEKFCPINLELEKHRYIQNYVVLHCLACRCKLNETIFSQSRYVHRHNGVTRMHPKQSNHFSSPLVLSSSFFLLLYVIFETKETCYTSF